MVAQHRLLGTLLLLAAAPQYASANNVPKQVIHDIVEGAERLSHTVKDNLHDDWEYVHHELDRIVQNSALAGNIVPVLKKLVITPEKASLIATKTAEVIQWQDLALIIFLGWFIVPLIKYPLENIMLAGQGGPRQSIARIDKLEESLVYQVGSILSQIAKLALLVYAVDVLKIFLTCMGFTFPHLNDLPKVFAKIVYTVWFVQRISKVKTHWISSLMDVRGESERVGRIKIVDRLIDGALLVVAAFFLFEVLSVNLGFAGKSFFALGGISTLVMSMALQGTATQLLNGLLLATSDRIYEGDSVRFGNGISGTIVKLGWMETVLRGSDEIMLTVPNADLASQQVSNLSRIHKCQVKQTLRFQYKDVDVLPLVVNEIKREIRAACPELITDGTRPFRVHITDNAEDHIEVVVDAHFNVKPVGDMYWDNRQRTLLAIHNAVKKYDIEFAIPS